MPASGMIFATDGCGHIERLKQHRTHSALPSSVAQYGDGDSHGRDARPPDDRPSGDGHTGHRPALFRAGDFRAPRLLAVRHRPGLAASGGAAAADAEACWRCSSRSCSPSSSSSPSAQSITWGFGKLGQWLFVNAGRFQAIYLDWTDWLEEHGLAIAGPLADRFNVGWLVGFIQGIAGRINSLAGFAVLVFIFVMLGLLEVDDFNARLRLPATQPYGEKILRANSQISGKLRRFMLVRSIASVLTGLVVWAFALIAGLELAAAWGAIAFALNYIPFLGPLVATVFPTLFAIAQFESWQMAVVVFAGLNLIQFIIGSYLEPLLTGASLAISPFAVIFAVFFWSFMWGLPGAFIGVPILIVFIVYCAQEPSSRWIATLLSAGTAAKVSGRAGCPARETSTSKDPKTHREWPMFSISLASAPSVYRCNPMRGAEANSM